jgi:hypothetical protein
VVRVREPQRIVEKKDLQALEDKFVNGIEKMVLKDLTLDELADQFESIDKQAQLFQGLILLEARERFESDKLFGEWCATRPLCLGSQTQRTRLMNLARFFSNREIIGISLTACYEISAPINADIADKVYQAALGKNLSVAQIKAEIANAKGLLPESVNEGSSEPELMPLGDISRFMEQVMADIGELPVNDAIRVLKECEKQLKKNSKTVTPVAD